MEKIVCGRGSPETGPTYFLKLLVNLQSEDNVVKEVWASQALWRDDLGKKVDHYDLVKDSRPCGTVYLLQKEWDMRTQWSLMQLSIESRCIHVKDEHNEATLGDIAGAGSLKFRNMVVEEWGKPNTDGPQVFFPPHGLKEQKTYDGATMWWVRPGWENVSLKSFPVQDVWVEESWWRIQAPSVVPRSGPLPSAAAASDVSASPNTKEEAKGEEKELKEADGEEEILFNYPHHSPARIGTTSPESTTVTPNNRQGRDEDADDDVLLKDKSWKRLRLF